MKMTVTAAVRKLCPYRDEIDEGTVIITFDVYEGDGPELHEVADYLASYAVVPMSHEAFTRMVASDYDAAVTSAWTTAGMAVTVDVPRDEL